MDPRSATWVADITRQVRDNWGGHPAFQTNSYAPPVWVAPADTPTVAVRWWDCQNKGYFSAAEAGLVTQLSAVPMPADAVPAAGTDGEMVVWQPSTDTLWEMWQARKREDGSWEACWGGRLQHASTSPDAAFGYPYGTTAAGLSLTAGLTRIDELQRGVIDHPLSFAVIETRRGAHSWPANRDDGWVEGEQHVAEGQRFRIDPTLDLSTIPMPPVTRALAVAAQRYGMVVRDTAGAVAIYAENAQPSITRLGTNPYVALFGATPDWAILDTFPWDRLQALPFDYGR